VLLRDYPEHASTVSDIQWIPAGAGSKRPLLPSAAFGQLIFWDPESEEPVNRLEWKGSLLAIAWSPNGNFVASGNQDSTVHFWFIEGGEDLQMTGYPAEVREL
jgi:WD40 repeat protein